MKKLAIILVVITLLVLATVAVNAQTGSGYALTWWTIDGGGIQNSGGAGGYALSATIGQPDPGLARAGAYEIAGGFWSGSTRPGFRQYLPAVVR